MCTKKIQFHRMIKNVSSPHLKLHLQQKGDEAGQAMTASSLGLSSTTPSENSKLREPTEKAIKRKSFKLGTILCYHNQCILT